MLKLERGTDYSESDFENFVRMNLDIHNQNESRNQDENNVNDQKLNLMKDDKNILEEEEGGGEYDFDDDDSDMMEIEGVGFNIQYSVFSVQY